MVTFAGWQLDVKIGTTLASVTGSTPSATSIDGIQRVTFDYVSGIEKKEATGQRLIYTIVEGTIGLTGTLERFWTGSGIDAYVRGSGETGSMTSYFIGIYPNGAVTGQPYVALDTVKFSANRRSQRPGAQLLTQTLDFIGTREWNGTL